MVKQLTELGELMKVVSKLAKGTRSVVSVKIGSCAKLHVALGLFTHVFGP